MAKAAARQAETESDVNDDVDTLHEVADIRTGQVSEARLEIQREVARNLGWTPKEDWKRDPEKWVDADKFLENTPREMELLKDRLRRTSQAAEAVIEDQRRQAKREAIEELRAAERAGDADRANAAAERVAAAEGPPAVVQSWIRDNPWFSEDQEAADLARGITNRLAAEGRSITEQLEEARKAVMKRFPEHAGQAERREEPTETRLSEVRRPPPMATGSRGSGSTTREKGWGDIPSADRGQATKLIRAMVTRGLSEADAQGRYARSYWSERT